MSRGFRLISRMASAAVGRRRAMLLYFLATRLMAFARTGFNLKWAGQGQPIAAYQNTDRAVHFNHIALIALKHVLRIKRIKRITTSATCVTDGAGHQMLMRIYAFAFARNAGLAYVHTPPVWLHQAERPMDDYCRAWDNLFNLGAGNEVATRADLSLFDYSSGGQWLLDLLFRRADALTSLDPVAVELRERYTGVRTLRRPGEPLDICIHVRRGWDVTRAREDMWTEGSYIRAVIIRLTDRLDAQGVPFRLTIASQGSRADFADIDGPNVEFHLDPDPLVTVQRLADADVLIVGRSSFSFIAGVVSKGIVLFEPGKYRPMSNWLALDLAGDFDPERFAGQVSRHLSGR